MRFFITPAILFLCMTSAVMGQTTYTGDHLNRVAFPVGGMGAGMYCLEGTGAISHMSIKNQMDFFSEPCCYAAVCVLGEDGPDGAKTQNVARVVEGLTPEWKIFGRPGAGVGSGGSTYGLPRFRECAFTCRFPFATIDLKDDVLPVTARITGWSPFTPPSQDDSGMPVGALEYTFRNPTKKPMRCIFTFNSRNFLNHRGSIGPVPGGFVLYDRVKPAEREKKGAFAVFVDGEKNVTVDHCWFRGGWFDAFTVAWENVAAGNIIENPPVEGDNAPGATLAVPFTLPPGGEKTIRLMTCWYWPDSGLNTGRRADNASYKLFGKGPSRGTVAHQQPVTGFLGQGLVNTYDPGGDSPQGVLVSPEIPLNKKFMHVLVGGGTECGVELYVDGKSVYRAAGLDTEELRWVTFDLAPYQGKKGVIKIVDRQSDGWGHILCDHIILSTEEIITLKIGDGNMITADPARVTLIADFEGEDFGAWTAEHSDEEKSDAQRAAQNAPVCDPELMICTDAPIPPAYTPWYTTQCGSVTEVARWWRENYARLREKSALFTRTFYDTTLPPEVVESVAVNLSILKSPTVLRQHDGRLWCWEGCNDHGGSCDGTCTHVWNYTQAICHLFPEMERSLRQTEYFESSWDGTGRQAFRANLPISPGGNMYDAADGQLGGIMKMYREWRISGNNQWLKLYWPRIQRSMDFMIEKYDPRHTGLLEEDHHNTYDINYYGPDGHCGSFYLGALAAMVEMGTFLGEDVTFYQELLEKGKKRIVADLFNGEYFIQQVWKTGLDHNFGPINPADQSVGYRKIAELINEQGPKYQYGTGCLSDGVLGFWIARCCGLDAEIVPAEYVRSHLLAVHKYNLKKDLAGHANPQRPTFAMRDDGGLLLCSWPRGGKPMLPFVYSDEVWTGIEYQVASHLMMLGQPEEALEIVALVRKRYDGTRRNPFNEYECGHWYARALSSYGMLQGLTGVRYDAVTKTLIVDARLPEFRTFLCTATGFGTVVYKDGKAELIVTSGEIPVEKITVR